MDPTTAVGKKKTPKIGKKEKKPTNKKRNHF